MTVAHRDSYQWKQLPMNAPMDTLNPSTQLSLDMIHTHTRWHASATYYTHTLTCISYIWHTHTLTCISYIWHTHTLTCISYIWHTHTLTEKSQEHLPLKVDATVPPLPDDVHKVSGQNEWHPLPPHSILALEVAQEVAKIDMEELIKEMTVREHIQRKHKS